MNITLNGKPHRLDTATSITALVDGLSLNAAQVAIERNTEIVPRSRWNEEMLVEGDTIEVVRFIGGG